MEYGLLKNMARTGVNSILSTSAGRLFDAVSAILGIRRSSTFEGEAATALMFAAQRYEQKIGASYPEQMKKLQWISEKIEDTNKLVRLIAEERLKGAEPDMLALAFHMKLADMIVDRIIRLSNDTGIKVAALSGGVFQNTLLLRCVETLINKYNETKEGTNEVIRILRHSQIPPNDGGIAVGQALYGLAKLGVEAISK
jgi:hydrogenase maturation protein HypF